MPPIKIRYADETDVNLIKNISWQTFFDTFHLHNTKEDMQMFLAKNFNEEAVRKEIKNTKNTFMIALIQKQVVGYAKLSDINEPPELSTTKHIEVSRLYTSKEKIGSGVGKTLMAECIECAKQKTKEVIWLGVWEQNQRAIQFYRRRGFEKFGEQDFILGYDVQKDWLMKKHLEYD